MPRYLLADLLLGLFYLFSNPFTLCRRRLQKRGEEGVYGETPLTAWQKIAEEAEIQPTDHLLDLGCGRGKLLFWSALWIGCRSSGIDLVDVFIRRGSLLSKILNIKQLQFKKKSLCCMPFGDATVIYLYTFHPDEERLDFSKLSSGVRVITISDRICHPKLEVIKIVPVEFPWGESEAYIHQVKI